VALLVSLARMVSPSLAALAGFGVSGLLHTHLRPFTHTLLPSIRVDLSWHTVPYPLTTTVPPRTPGDTGTGCLPFLRSPMPSAVLRGTGFFPTSCCIHLPRRLNMANPSNYPTRVLCLSSSMRACAAVPHGCDVRRDAAFYHCTQHGRTLPATPPAIAPVLLTIYAFVLLTCRTNRRRRIIVALRVLYNRTRLLLAVPYLLLVMPV
jgi:hypothetical protein